MVAIITSILVVHPSLPAKSVKELIALAKAKPDALSYASTGNGAPTHLAGELFKSMAGVKMLHIPYKGAAPAVVDLISGHVQLSFISAPGAMPHLQGGRLRVLAVTNSKRSVLLPEIPTISEAGLKGYESEGWHGLFTPAGTPKPVIDRLYKEISTLLRDQKISSLLAAGGAEPVGMPPEEFGRKLNLEIEKWAKVVKSSGMKVD
jgi:tripartite-type tricarboxylate transporter receptor subunit TctC